MQREYLETSNHFSCRKGAILTLTSSPFQPLAMPGSPLADAEPSQIAGSGDGSLPVRHGLSTVSRNLNFTGDRIIRMGASKDPAGNEILVDAVSLVFNGKRWLPTSGEYHYSRNPRQYWKQEILKMKAGGLDIVSSYVFWIHHEEIEGEWDWSGNRSLRRFLELCRETGMYANVRIGPWVHGECRNGGLPDWIMGEPYKPRSLDRRFLEKAGQLYRQIFAQAQGLLWKDGGPVISVQIENEFGGHPDYMLELKRMALDAGFDVPLYTRTGWPSSSEPYPFGEMVPLFGDYPDGFWVSEPSGSERFLAAYLLTTDRASTDLGAITAGSGRGADDSAESYPYFCCEIGGGMASSYHRRLHIDPMDVGALALAKLATGNNLQGFYMYHGGTNPDGKLTDLHECQASGYPCELPVKTYDFQAPLGEFGQVRAHYHLLRRLSIFQRSFGADLARMPVVFPIERAASHADHRSLRWCVRSDGYSGYLFVNNYQRFANMGEKSDVQFAVGLEKGVLALPANPIAIPANSAFFWPFHLQIGGVNIVYATAQPIAAIEHDGSHYLFFAETKGVPAEFVFRDCIVRTETSARRHADLSGAAHVAGVAPCRSVSITATSRRGEDVHIVLLSQSDSLSLYSEVFAGRPRVFLSEYPLRVDGDTLRLRCEGNAEAVVGVFPPLDKPSEESDGIFGVCRAVCPGGASARNLRSELVRQAGPAPEIRNGHAGMPQQPDEKAFETAAMWRIRMPKGRPGERLLLRIRYTGDVARLYCGARLLTDNFFTGDDFEVDLSFFPETEGCDTLILKTLPLRRDHRIYIQQEGKVRCDEWESVARLHSVQIIEITEPAFTI